MRRAIFSNLGDGRGVINPARFNPGAPFGLSKSAVARPSANSGRTIFKGRVNNQIAGDLQFGDLCGDSQVKLLDTSYAHRPKANGVGLGLA